MFPVLYLLAMIPLPQFFHQTLSSQLQLISSKLGVGCLQFVGVTSFRDGNVIDLGPIQLQVVEACSGLRYLFPLMSLALLCAYLYKDQLWKRAFVFLSSIPIAIVLNGFRIGMIGILVDAYGRVAAEGFYHFFEGWVIFIASLSLILLEIWLLSKLSRTSDTRPFLNRFSFSNGAVVGSHKEMMTPKRVIPSRGIPLAYLCSLVLLVPVLLASTHISVRDELVPPRQSLVDFPMILGNWKGESYPMEKRYTDALRFDDYILADYQRGSQSGPVVNAYVAYYSSQQKGRSVHSPRTCIPGGGWEIQSLLTSELGEVDGFSTPLRINRALIQKGKERQLVYYWFQQRGRNLTNEYLVKWYLFWDALTRQRTDGSLVRLTVPIASIDGEKSADETLQDFAKLIRPVLADYVPD